MENQTYENMGLRSSQLIGTLFDGAARHTPEGIAWRDLALKEGFREAVLPGAILRKLTDEEMNRYREPYVDPPSRKPVWRWPNEIPIDGEPADVTEIVEAYSEWFGKSDVPKLLLYAQPGALMREPLVEWCRKNMRNLKTVEIGAGAHFVQEDQPQAIGEAVAAWYRGL